jgi:hypothetical protein
MLDLLGRHDAAVEGARFVAASFAHVLAPMHRAGPAEAGRVNRERISVFPFKLEALAGTLVPGWRL